MFLQQRSSSQADTFLQNLSWHCGSRHVYQCFITQERMIRIVSQLSLAFIKSAKQYSCIQILVAGRKIYQLYKEPKRLQSALIVMKHRQRSILKTFVSDSIQIPRISMTRRRARLLQAIWVTVFLRKTWSCEKCWQKPKRRVKVLRTTVLAMSFVQNLRYLHTKKMIQMSRKSNISLCTGLEIQVESQSSPMLMNERNSMVRLNAMQDTIDRVALQPPDIVQYKHIQFMCSKKKRTNQNPITKLIQPMKKAATIIQVVIAIPIENSLAKKSQKPGRVRQTSTKEARMKMWLMMKRTMKASLLLKSETVLKERQNLATKNYIDTIMNYIDHQNSVGVKQQNRRNNIRKSSLFRLQGHKEKVEEMVQSQKFSKLIKHYPAITPHLEHYSELAKLFFKYCFENNQADSTVLNLGNNYRNKNFGFSRITNKTIFRDWLPGCTKAFLFGDFNKWAKDSHPLNPIGNDFFQIQLQDDQYGKEVIESGSRVKLLLINGKGEQDIMLPPSARHLKFNQQLKEYQAFYLNNVFKWENINPPKSKAAYIFEIDMRKLKPAQIQNLSEDLLRNVASTGFNTVLLKGMFLNGRRGSLSPLHQFILDVDLVGLVDQFKTFIDEAHSLNLKAITSFHLMLYDHKVNWIEAIFLQETKKDRVLFDLTNTAVVSYILASLAFCMKEFNIDGFKFIGLQELLLKSKNKSLFKGPYQEMAKDSDIHGQVFLMTLRHLINKIQENAIVVAGMDGFYPGLTFSIMDGGLGFNFIELESLPASALFKSQTKFSELFDYLEHQKIFLREEVWPGMDLRTKKVYDSLRFALCDQGYSKNDYDVLMGQGQQEIKALNREILQIKNLQAQQLYSNFLIDQFPNLVISRDSVNYFFRFTEGSSKFKVETANNKSEILLDPQEFQTVFKQDQSQIRLEVKGPGVLVLMADSVKISEEEAEEEAVFIEI